MQNADHAMSHMRRARIIALLMSMGLDELNVQMIAPPGIEARPEPAKRKPPVPQHNAREVLTLDEEEGKRLNAAWGGVRPSKADMPIEPYYRDRRGSLRRVFPK